MMIDLTLAPTVSDGRRNDLPDPGMGQVDTILPQVIGNSP
jgi:hypothetical protein